MNIERHSVTVFGWMMMNIERHDVTVFGWMRIEVVMGKTLW